MDLDPTILTFKKQLEISHSNLLSKTCTFALKWNVSQLSVWGEWKAFRLPLKNAKV